MSSIWLVAFAIIITQLGCAPQGKVYDLASAAPVTPGGAKSSGSRQGTFVSDSATERAALNILKQSCQSCHNSNSPKGGLTTVTDLDKMVDDGFVIPEKPEDSLLIESLSGSSGTARVKAMPPGSHLAANDVNTLKSWIANMKEQFPAHKVPSVSTTTTTTIPAAASISYLNQVKPLMTQYCTSCHKAGKASGGYAYDTYAKTILSVTANNPAASPLYTAVATRKTMPKGKSYRFTAAQNKILFDWISQGAPNN